MMDITLQFFVLLLVHHEYLDGLIQETLLVVAELEQLLGLAHVHYFGHDGPVAVVQVYGEVRKVFQFYRRYQTNYQIG